MTAPDESHRYELDVTLRRPGQPDCTISREYVSKDAASTDKAANEVFEAINPNTRARMCPVNDGR